MKNVYTLLTLLALSSVLFVSCEKENEDNNTTEEQPITATSSEKYAISIQNNSNSFNWGEIENYSTDSTDITFKAIGSDVTISYLGENRIAYPEWTPEKIGKNCTNSISHHAFTLNFPQSITLKKGEVVTKTIKFYATSFSYYIEQGVNQFGSPNCVLKNSYGEGTYKSELQFEVIVDGVKEQHNFTIEGQSKEPK